MIFAEIDGQGPQVMDQGSPVQSSFSIDTGRRPEEETATVKQEIHTLHLIVHSLQPGDWEHAFYSVHTLAKRLPYQ